jgi:hypothetical protein
METTEKIVEAYVRYVKGWATIPNLRCDAQKEIDLFAIDPVTDERWHKERVKAAAARRKLGFFLAEKFLPVAVEKRLACLGCAPGKLRRAIVTWDWKSGVDEAAAAEGIELWSLPALMQEVADKARQGRAYLADDILRTFDLFARGLEAERKRQRVSVAANQQSDAPSPSLLTQTEGNVTGFYVYENWIHGRARLHQADCSHCNAGKGTHGATGEKTGRWYAHDTLEAARAQLGLLKYKDKGECPACM